MKNLTVIQLVKKYGVRPKKPLGQNFLMDQNLMDKLIDALELYPDEDVLEIGSGLGVFSKRVAAQAQRVVAIEKDKRLFEIASEQFEDQKNLKFILDDFLKLDLQALTKKLELPLKVIGNIPYYISSPILFKLLDNKSLFDVAVLTVQKEVAKRIIAEPDSKDYGILSILVQAQAEVEILFDLEGGAFYPPPEITSSAIKITFAKRPLYPLRDFPFFKKVVKTAFNQRRKTIKNTLKILLKNNKIKPWEPCEIDPESRPEQLSIAQYVTLANFLHSLL